MTQHVRPTMCREGASNSMRLAAVGCLFVLTVMGCDRPGRGQEATPSATPCEDFATQLCSKTENALSTTCMNIKTTTELFTPDTCRIALQNVAHSLAALGKRDLTCDGLQAKLCADMDASSKACEMVKQYTKRFPPQKCKEMLGRYPDVLADLKKAKVGR
jgi:hypothetical protein